MRSIAVAALLLAAAPAAAHFRLVSPSAMNRQNLAGDPQKSIPCGQDDAGDPWVPTNEVTVVRPGSTLTVTIDETIYHPGHYRVALARTMGELPPHPPVTAGGNTACGSVPIASSPVLPVLADGQLVHTSAFSSERSFDVQIPAGMECEGCILQVMEWMSNHAAPCFYYHCATITVSSTAPLHDAGGSPDGGGGNVDEPGGCCGTGAGASGSAMIALGVLAFLPPRRRRSAARARDGLDLDPPRG